MDSSLALVSPCGRVEVFGGKDGGVDVHDVLQEPIHLLSVRGFRLFFSSAAYLHAEVNEFASSLAQQLIKGDACLVHDQHQQLLDCLQQSKQLRIAQSEAACTPKHSSSSQAVLVSSVELDQPRPSSGTPGADSSCLLKRPGSLQHIAAANSTRQRILRSMSAAGASSPPAALQPPPTPATQCGRQRTRDAPRTSSDDVYGSSLDSVNSSSSSFSCHTGRHRLPTISSSSDSRTSTLPFNAHSRSKGEQTSTPTLQQQQQQWRSSSDPHAMPAYHDAVPMDVDPQQQDMLAGAGLAGAVSAAAAAPVWSDLPVEVIAQVARFLGSTVAAIMPVCMTCRSWRQAVLEDDQLLQGLHFKLNVSPPRASSHNRTRTQHPLLLQRAAKLGNVSALVVSARLLDAAGACDEAMRCWRRAAKAGHLEGQLLYGLALYRGTAGVAPDAEDAHMWLSKALKQVLGSKPAGSSPSSAGCAGSSSSTATTSSGDSTSATTNNNEEGCVDKSRQMAGSSSSSIRPAFAVPSNCVATAACGGPPPGLHARVLMQAGLVLGYLLFDGEGTRSDTQAALRCFKLAAQAGCREAQQVLGWIFNTGQY